MYAKLQFVLFAICLDQICGLNYRNLDFAEEETMLRQGLFRNYDKDVIPRVSASKPLVVNHTMNLIRIESIKNGVLSVETWMQMMWVDHRLSWDRLRWPGITFMRADSSKIWKPEIYLYNFVGSVFGFKYEDVRVVIQYDGTVIWIPPIRLSVPCNSNHANFTCTFKFGSWVYNGYELNLTNTLNSVSMTDLHPNSEIDVISSSAKRNERFYACCPEPYIDVTYSLTMEHGNGGTVSEAMPLQMNSPTSTTEIDDSSDESSDE